MHSSREDRTTPELENGSKVLQKLAGPRQLTGWQGILIFVIALSWSAFQLSLGSILILNSTLIRSIHLAFALSIVFVTFPLFKSPKSSRTFAPITQRNRFHIFELLIAGIACLVALYIALDYTGIAERIGNPIPRDRLFGILLFLMLLEAARRVVGPALPILASLFVLYAFFGPYMPSLIAFKGISLDRFLGQITMSTEGIYGVPLGVSANIVFLFVLFGSMLERAGGGKYFIQLSTSLLGSFRGGPAKAAILSSGLTGMINGSSIANVVTTGTFTIPLMKSVGYPAKKAAAIEVASSTNGQLMPPIMGAAAFIIAEYVNLPYIAVVKAAFLPALVSYVALFYISHLEACKLGIRGLSRNELPAFIPTFLSGLHYLIPIAVLIYKLVFLRHTPESSAFLAIIFLAGVMLVQEPFKEAIAGRPLMPGVWKGIKLLFESLVQGARNNVTVAVACASAGIIVGIVTMGPGGMLTEAVSFISGGKIYILLGITAFACLMLGMGLPTTANYIVMASLTAPIIVNVGGAAGLIVPLMAAHLFVFYFGILADDTPPVGLAAYAAAAIAKSDPIPTGVQGFMYDIRTAVLPFMFIFNTELILWGIQSWIQAIMLFLTAAFGGLAFASATQGWFITRNRWYELIGLLLVTLIAFQPQIPARLLGYEGSSLLRVREIIDPESFVDRLHNARDPVSEYIYSELTGETRQILDEYDGSRPPSVELLKALVGGINRLLEDESIYETGRFSHINLTSETRKLMNKNPHGAELIKLNRILIEEAYTHEISNCRYYRKYLSYFLALGIWCLIYLNQRMRIRRE